MSRGGGDGYGAVGGDGYRAVGVDRRRGHWAMPDWLDWEDDSTGEAKNLRPLLGEWTSIDLGLRPVRDRWYRRAACSRHPDLPWTEPGGRHWTNDAMRSICAGCPVQLECLTDALETERGDWTTRASFRGGLGPGHRVELVRKLEVYPNAVEEFVAGEKRQVPRTPRHRLPRPVAPERWDWDEGEPELNLSVKPPKAEPPPYDPSDYLVPPLSIRLRAEAEMRFTLACASEGPAAEQQLEWAIACEERARELEATT